MIMTRVYQPSLVVQGQEVWIKWCKAHNRADHALTSRRRPFLLQIYELASIEGRRGGLIMAVSGIHVTIQIIVNGGGGHHAHYRENSTTKALGWNCSILYIDFLKAILALDCMSKCQKHCKPRAHVRSLKPIWEQGNIHHSSSQEPLWDVPFRIKNVLTSYMIEITDWLTCPFNMILQHLVKSTGGRQWRNWGVPPSPLHGKSS